MGGGRTDGGWGVVWRGVRGVGGAVADINAAHRKRERCKLEGGQKGIRIMALAYE